MSVTAREALEDSADSHEARGINHLRIAQAIRSGLKNHPLTELPSRERLAAMETKYSVNNDRIAELADKEKFSASLRLLIAHSMNDLIAAGILVKEPKAAEKSFAEPAPSEQTHS